MGGKKLYSLLQADIHSIDASMGRDKFFDLLRQWSLLVQCRRKYAPNRSIGFVYTKTSCMILRLDVRTRHGYVI